MRAIDADLLKQFIIEVWKWEELSKLPADLVLYQTLIDIDNMPTVKGKENDKLEK